MKYGILLWWLLGWDEGFVVVDEWFLLLVEIDFVEIFK